MEAPADPEAPKRRVWLRMLPVLAAAGVLMVWFYAALNSGADLPQRAMIGKPAPDFAVTGIGAHEGDSIELGTLVADGKPLVINFWASWCTVCKEEARDLDQFWRRHRDQVGLLGIAVNDRPKDALRFAERYGMSYPLAMDPNGSVAIDYGMMGVPETYIVAGDGTIAKRFIGTVTAAELEKALAALQTAQAASAESERG